MDYVTNVINALTPWWTSITIIGYLIGVALFLASAHSAINSAKERHSSAYFWLFLASILCLNLPAIMNAVSFSIFKAKSATDLLAYTSDATNGAEYLTFSFRAVMLIGLIGIIRGVLFLRDTPQRPKDISKALTHSIGGTLAVNIVQFLNAIGATAGGDVQSYIEVIT